MLIGRESRIRETMAAAGLAHVEDLEIHNAKVSKNNKRYADFLYGRLQRRGSLQRDCQRMVNQDRNIFGACMLANADADAMVTGLTRSFAVCFDEISRVIDPLPDHVLYGLSILVARGRTVFIADTTVNEFPSPVQLADIAVQTATKARLMGHEPRVAFLSFSNFGQPLRERAQHVRDAIALLDERDVGFEYDGEMSADVALDFELKQRLYPFCRLSGPANVLIMPALHAANIGAKLLQQLGDATLVGPLLIGLEKPAQVVQMGATVNEIVTAAAIASHDAIQAERGEAPAAVVELRSLSE